MIYQFKHHVKSLKLQYATTASFPEAPFVSIQYSLYTAGTRLKFVEHFCTVYKFNVHLLLREALLTIIYGTVFTLIAASLLGFSTAVDFVLHRLPIPPRSYRSHKFHERKYYDNKI